MSSGYKHIFWLLFLGFYVLNAQEQNVVADSLSRVFKLGEVQVVGKKSHPFTLTLNAEDLAASQNRDVSQALALLPGLNICTLGSEE